MSAVMGVLRVLQRPRTRCFLLAIVLAGVSLALLYHNLGPSGQQAAGAPTPVVTEQQVRLADVQQDHHHPHPVAKKVTPSTLSITEPCSPVAPAKHVDILTSEVYPTLNFNPHYRTYWNHTFERRYLKKKEHWDKLPLKVIVIPHSHNDPGWLKTFDGYFMGSTAHILNNMVDKLARYRDMTFVFSEMSFFSRWWNSLKNRPHLRDQVRQFLQRGQLELLTGGWVMTDEAAAHYFAMIDQLVEGHQWMLTNLGVVPRMGWSIDSFGHCATVPYLLRVAGLRNMVIQRTHYAWKAYLAEKEQLDFWWRQEFDAMSRNNLSSDILCQMMPFDLYSIKHSCGPDPDICLQFDFRRIPGEYSESRAVPVTPDKVADRAELLLGQYGRIGSLFPHNVALVPLGDDFRYNHDVEWDQQYENYKKLFDYINSRADWHAEVKFGTLSDYFHEVHKRMNSLGYSSIPTLVGDFHAYGDIYGEGRPSYWTGYYTTRPYWKHMCRDLQHWLRSAEILYTLSRAYVRQQGQTHLAKRLEQDYAYLTFARDSLGLFQHHDAITGTSKEAVMADYGMRLYRGIRETMGIVAHAALYVMAEDAVKRSVDLRPAHPLTSYIYPDIEQNAFDKLPEKVPLTIPVVGGRKIVIFNSKGLRSVEPIRVKITSAFVKLLDPKGNEIPVQVNPAWNGSVDVLSGTYEALFLADLPPLSLSTYTFIASEHPPHPRSQISVALNDAFAKQPQNSVFSFESPSESDIELSSPYLTATFSKHTGLVQSMELPGYDIINRVVMVLQAYKSEEFRSGAYLFHPSTSDPVQNVSGRFPIIRVVRGHLCSEVTAVYSNAITVTHRLYHSERVLGTGLELEVIFDMNNLPEINLELFLRLQTDVQSGKVFYTDSNGFQMIKRITHTQLPLEANFYPVTSSVFLEDSRSRLTLLLSHAHGAASINSGWLEVMLDRRLRSDDNRGLGEGVLDNKRTMARFWLLLEKVDSSSPDEVPNLSVSGHMLSELLSDSSVVVATHGTEQRNLKPAMEFLGSPLSCNVYLLNLRTIPMGTDFDAPSNNSLLILHHKGASCKVRSHIPGPCSQKGTSVNIALQHVTVSSIYRTSLTGLHPEKNIYNGSVVYVEPMQIDTYNVGFFP